MRYHVKRRIILIVAILFLLFNSAQGYAQPKKCPVLNELEQTSIKDRSEVIKSLNILIPKTYGTGIPNLPDMYSKWNVITAQPFPKTIGNKNDEVYYGMAKTFCGKEIAKRSWLIRLNFPNAPGADLAQGQIFIAKSKEEGWFVWFRYH